MPWLYDGKDRTFFCAAFEGYRQETFLSDTITVPTELERAGDFSKSGVKIIDPTTGYSGRKICASADVNERQSLPMANRPTVFHTDYEVAVGADSHSLGCLYRCNNLVCLRNNFCQFEFNGVSKEKFHLLLYNNFTFISPKARQSRTMGSTSVGYFSRDSNAADPLYEIVNRRHERSAPLIATNRGFKGWNQVFPNATCIATLLDRLTRHADIAIIEGKSCRVRESELESTARRKASSPDSKSASGS